MVKQRQELELLSKEELSTRIGENTANLKAIGIMRAQTLKRYHPNNKLRTAAILKQLTDMNNRIEYETGLLNAEWLKRLDLDDFARACADATEQRYKVDALLVGCRVSCNVNNVPHEELKC